MAGRQGAAVGRRFAYYIVFSLAPLILVLLAILGLIFRNDPAGAWEKMTAQLGYFLDRSALDVVRSIAQKASETDKTIWATIIGVALALFGASGVFGQLQDALNTIWGVKAKPGHVTSRTAGKNRDLSLSKGPCRVTFTGFSQDYGLRNYQNRRQTVSRRRR